MKAVDGISLSCEDAKTLGLVGESGCGKTTVSRCILRLYRPTEGQILFEGGDIAQLPERQIKRSAERFNLSFKILMVR